MIKHLGGTKVILRVIIIIICVPILIMACQENIEPANNNEPPPLIKGVRIETAKIKDYPTFYEAVGTTTAGISTKLSSKLLGTIEKITVREGDKVKKDDPLLYIDPRQVKAGVREAQAGLDEAKKSLAAANSARDSAKAQEKLALVTYNRYKRLRDQKLVSTQQFDEIQAKYDQAKAALFRAEAMIDAAKSRINQAKAGVSVVDVSSLDAIIIAPHDGIITAKYVDKGDLASPGMPLLALETTVGFCVNVILPETYVDYVQPLKKVFVSVPALNTGNLDGNVCTIVPSADEKSRSFIVKINLPIDTSVRSGMFARVNIPLGFSKNLLIPERAIIKRGQLTGIFVLDSKNLVGYRLIRTGKSFGESTEILSGIDEGDRYIAEPGTNMIDGVRVEVVP